MRLGGEGYGWERTAEVDTNGRKVVREVVEETETVARIRELREAGLTLRGIADMLTKENRKTRKGGPWQATTILRIAERR